MRDRNSHRFDVGIEMDLVDQSGLVFCAGVKNHVFVCGANNPFFFDIDLVFACGPKMSCLCGDQKRMLVLVEVDLFFVSGPEIILLSCERRNLLGVCVDGQTLS